MILNKNLGQDAKEETNLNAEEAKKSQGKTRDLIQPRRVAIKFATKTMVFEYVDGNTGKLRHRSFRIDMERFESCEQCERKFWSKLSRTIVPNSVNRDQIKSLIAKLYLQEKSLNPDADELEDATKHFMNAESSASSDRKSEIGRQEKEVKEEKREERKREEEEAQEEAAANTTSSQVDATKILHDAKPAHAADKPERAEDKATTSKEVSLDNSIIEDEDIPDYADDFEDEEADSEYKPGGRTGKEKDGEEDTEKLDKVKKRDLDLQRVDENELLEYKQLMNIEFEKNAIKPGDPNWKYDVQVEFSDPEENASWDEEDDSPDETTFD
ncbi:hypothetical protein GUITHDRAFT_111517 [Guillardia theta CCMP2712]|uniref:Centrosomal protein of 19 kDa n=1 Tax=Guillardia theta (strain CCMP2712) TaxID=905079 RepID=L1J2J7_GUITC|nr:hypothetical protein GUITHDRAFT_111517 [Guillardia theta CCMP2712]EKX42542.1 hypothetical protein GUITHDRAFT_111517 [Guillardia theta CCMP2712]|eukprot:XP_005829522.1 hypothetical protein GUITHDRAFT_111517 [Guillardia theta CCMP2712]